MKKNQLMVDDLKTKDQLIKELDKLRKKTATLERDLALKTKSEADLKRSEEHFRMITENTADNISIISFDLKAKYLYVSPSVKPVFGYEPEELIGKSCFDFIHPEDKKYLLPLLKKYIGMKVKKLLLNKKSTLNEVVDFRFKKKNGGWYYMQSKINLFGNHLLSIARDISKQKRIEKRLQESESHYRQLFNLLPYGGELISVDGYILDCSLSTAKMLGYKRDELIGTHISNHLNSDLLKGFRENFSKLLKGASVSIEGGMIHKNGSVIEVLRAAEPILKKKGEVEAVIALSIDITKRKNAEAKVKLSEKEYRELFDNSSDAIYIQDEKLRFLDVNQGVVNMYGYPKDFFIGKTPDFLSAPGKNNLDDIVRCIEEAFKGVPQQFDFWGIRKNGEIFPKIVRCKSGYYMGKKVVIVFATDISDRVNAELEKANLEEQLQHAQKMEAIGTLAGGIAHDFNNILGAIIGYSDLILTNPFDGDKVKKYMKNVLKASTRAKEMIKRILSFSRKNEVLLAEVYLSKIITEAIEFLKSSLPVTIEFKTDIERDLKPIMVNSTQMNQVLMNLCTNSAHAMREDGGMITIGLKHIRLDEGPQVIGLNPGEYQLLKVQDTGVGISEDILGKIFEPYFTTKSIGEGTGMGLAVVYGIIKDYGGGIKVRSEIGKGTVFEIYLPVVQNVEEKIKDEKEFPFLKGNEERILFVDDEAFIVDMNNDLLNGFGYRVEGYTDSLKALTVFKSEPEKYDILITDMTMPNMTGAKLTAEVHKIRPDLPVIVCTGFSDHINDDNFRSMGVDALVMKPVVIKELLKIIRNVLKKKMESH